MTPIIRHPKNDIPWAVAPSGKSPAENIPMGDVDMSMSVMGNTCVVMNRFPRAGHSAPGHRHDYIHQSLLTNGRIRVSVDGKETEYSAPKIIYIEADKSHQFTALEDNTILWCVHASRDLTGEVLAFDAPADTVMHAISKGI